MICADDGYTIERDLTFILDQNKIIVTPKEAQKGDAYIYLNNIRVPINVNYLSTDYSIKILHGAIKLTDYIINTETEIVEFKSKGSQEEE